MDERSKKVTKGIIFLVSFLVIVFLMAAVAYTFASGKTGVKVQTAPGVQGNAVFGAPAKVNTQVAKPSSAGTTKNTGAKTNNSVIPASQPAVKPVPSELKNGECLTWEKWEETCKAPNGCWGTKEKSCVSGKWQYTACTSTLVMCSSGSCMSECNADRENLASKYKLDKNSLVFYYKNETHSNKMLEFIKSINNVYLLKYGNDSDLEQFLGLKGTVPTIICFSNRASKSGEMTKEEVEQFRTGNC